MEYIFIKGLFSSKYEPPPTYESKTSFTIVRKTETSGKRKIQVKNFVF